MNLVSRGNEEAFKVQRQQQSPQWDFTRAVVAHVAYVIYGNDDSTIPRTTILLQAVANVRASSSEKKPASGAAQPLLAAHVLGYPCSVGSHSGSSPESCFGVYTRVDLFQLFSRARSTNVGDREEQ